MFDSSFLTALLGSSHRTPPEVISIPKDSLFDSRRVHLVEVLEDFVARTCRTS
jgi:hypothetical protein